MSHHSFSKFWKGRSKKDKSHSNATAAKVSPGENVSQAPSTEQSPLQVLEPSETKEGLWRTAWERAKKESKWDPPPEWGLDSLPQHDEIKLVREEAKSRAKQAKESESNLPGTELSFRQLYDNVANWADKFTCVGDVVSQAVPGYGTVPWAIIRLVITASVSENNTYHTMLEGADLVSQLLAQYRAIEETYAKLNSDLATALRGTLLTFYVVILKFQIRAIKYFDRDHKILRAVRGLNPVSANDIQQQRAEIDKAKEHVDDSIALVSSDVTKRGMDELIEGKDELLAEQKQQWEQLCATRNAILVLSQDTRSQLADANKQQEHFRVFIEMWERPLDELRAKLEEDELRDIRDWLSLTEPNTDRSNARGKRPLNLGDWLVEHPKFTQWQHSVQSQVLWLYGFAGTGKTGLVCRVLQHLEDELESETPGRLAFFFCSNDKAGTGRGETSPRANPEEALRSIVSQLATTKRKGAVPILQSKYDEFGPNSDKRRKLDYSECVEILVAISSDTPITIVIDAFDECDQDKSPELIQHLEDVVHQAAQNVKIFISTRSFPAIENELTPDQSVEVTTENNGKDVRTFIVKSLQARIENQDLLNGDVSLELRKDIEDQLTSRARNMFLYASLLLNQLCDRNRRDDEYSIRKKLKQLPKDLTDVYDRIMEEIHHKDNSQRSRVIAQDTFKFLLCAQEPLSCDSVLEAISPPDRCATLDEVKRACRTLVIEENKALTFAHYSVREHIRELEAYRPSQCHIVAARSCLQILSMSSGPGKADEALSNPKKALRHYAVLHWPLHYEGIEQDDMGEYRAAINTMLRTFLLQNRSPTDKYSTYSDWLAKAQGRARELKDAGNLISKLKSLQKSPPTPLFAACVFGLEDIIGRFGREPNGLNQCNDFGQSALCLAIENNKLGAVKSLMSRRFPADVNLPSVQAIQQLEGFDEANPPNPVLFASPLQCAAALGRFEIVKFLVGEGANVNLVAGVHGSALQAAAGKGHANVVSFLLNKGADPNSQGGYYGNALQAAAAGGHDNIIGLLLENKPPALVRTPGGHYGSALMAAIRSGKSDNVWAILDDGADPNMRSKIYGRPLEMAASKGQGYKAIVSHLLTSRAEADLTPTDTSMHILHQAAKHDMSDLVEYCLQNGCKIDMITTIDSGYPRRFGDFPSEMTPLAFACAEGHVGMVDFLLRNGAPFEEGKPNSAVLWLAALLGHGTVIDLLLRRFKEKHNKEETDRFLKQRPSPRSGHPILWAAVSSGKADAVRSLLDHGVRYESNWFEATPLLASAQYKSPEVARVLLHYYKEGIIDVRINQPAKHGRTALMEACQNNLYEVAKPILEAGADYTAGANGNATALHMTVHNRDNSGLVALLLDRASGDLDKSRLQNFLNRQHASGRTAMMEAADSSHIKMLLQKEADFTILDNDGNTALHWAAGKGLDGAVDALLKKAGHAFTNEPQRFRDFLNLREKRNRTALVTAAQESRQSTIQKLLEYDADFTIEDNEGCIVLHHMAARGLDDAVKALLRKAKAAYINDPQRFKAFLSHPQKRNRTPLIEAAQHNQVSMIRLLLQHGADYSRDTMARLTPLHLLSFQGCKEGVSLLLERASADSNRERAQDFLDFRNEWGNTGLMDAAVKNSVEIVRMLLDHGADYSIGNNEQFTALHFCAFRNGLASVRALLKHASQDRTDEGRKFKQFLNQQGTGNRASALRDAASRGFTDVVRELIAYGPEHDLFDAKKCTPIHHAVRGSNTEMFHVLFDYAKRGRDWEKLKRVANAKDDAGENLWVAARKRNNQGIMRALKSSGLEIEGM